MCTKQLAAVDAKKIAGCRVFVVMERFNIAVNDFDEKESASCRRAFLLTEFVCKRDSVSVFEFLIAKNTLPPLSYQRVYMYDEHYSCQACL